MLRKMVLSLALLCVVWQMTMCATFAEAEDPVVVRVGDVTFTKSQLQSDIDTDIDFFFKTIRY